MIDVRLKHGSADGISLHGKLYSRCGDGPGAGTNAPGKLCLVVTIHLALNFQSLTMNHLVLPGLIHYNVSLDRCDGQNA